jgi:Auxiliary Activity family 9 (formerly GH61)
MKKVDSAIQDTAAGDGWFKIWAQGYDESTQQWCTNKLINNGGYLTVTVPSGLLGGYYLIRGELLALHIATAPANNPQYYIGCAQLFIQSTGNLVPVSTVTIPGIAKAGDAANNYDIYQKPLSLPYPAAGGPVTTFQPASGAKAVAQTQQTEGLKPANCVCQSGSNFCAHEVQDYTNSTGCWPVRYPLPTTLVD